MRRIRCLTLCLIAVAAACNREPDNTLPVLVGDVTSPAPTPVAVKSTVERPAPSLRLRVYPDMAVPGREVVVRADIGSVISGEPTELTFEATNDPCGGEMVQEGSQVVYKVPKDCRGSKIEITALLKGDFGEVTKAVSLEIKGATSSDSVVLRSPLPWEKVISPVLARWDRSLYQNRKETLQFKVNLQGMFLFGTPMLDPISVVELDLPPSPEDVIVKAATSGESEENLTLKVTERKAPFFPPWARVVHDCRGENGHLAPRVKVLDQGGETDVGVGQRFGTQGVDTFTYVYYHVGKKQRFDRKESPMGVEFQVEGDASSATYEFAHVWVKGDKSGGFSSPVYVTIKGNMGGQRRFKIVRARETWFDFRFPIKAALKEGSGESVKSISVYVDARDVEPPLALFLLGGIYLEPAGAPSGQSVQELPPSGVEPEPGEAVPGMLPGMLPGTEGGSRDGGRAVVPGTEDGSRDGGSRDGGRAVVPGTEDTGGAGAASTSNASRSGAEGGKGTSHAVVGKAKAGSSPGATTSIGGTPADGAKSKGGKKGTAGKPAAGGSTIPEDAPEP